MPQPGGYHRSGKENSVSLHRYNDGDQCILPACFIFLFRVRSVRPARSSTGNRAAGSSVVSSRLRPDAEAKVINSSGQNYR